MKNILFVASEGVPFIKTGGLADVVGSLPKCIDKEYFDIRVILPKYTCMKQEMKDRLTYKTHFYMDFHWKEEYVGIMEAEADLPPEERTLHEPLDIMNIFEIFELNQIAAAVMKLSGVIGGQGKDVTAVKELKNS